MKLIIDIPEDIYNHTQAYEIGGFNQENDARVFDLIKYGIPLDDVKRELSYINTYERKGYLIMADVWKVLDNITNAEREEE